MQASKVPRTQLWANRDELSPLRTDLLSVLTTANQPPRVPSSDWPEVLATDIYPR